MSSNIHRRNLRRQHRATAHFQVTEHKVQRLARNEFGVAIMDTDDNGNEVFRMETVTVWRRKLLSHQQPFKKWLKGLTE